ncbi:MULTISPECIES: DNA polymerase IV [unclassified Microbacterium]|uniref:DNA polymerase IV n=1 Tax=unclassified Microbacterium TaxID=2609290 RepID=UPI000EA99E6C|nr:MULTISPECIES: DNA polymerase IV [unclassified Microbacterium]MBT2483517.1 DNA polymerase IV [Microbacterium sp. ISL-108]RKN69400.1 DNA polymerase IV [Microbacterium sp. CGR2]
MHGEATVLHADLDAFYASVEQRDSPALRGRPVIVGGGVVLAASYEAKARGVRTAMGGRQALRLCPDAVVVPPRMDAYSQASRDVFAIFRDTTPLVEGLSIDEAFLEVGGLRRLAGTPEEVAMRLRERVRTDVGLAISVGVARTKFLAKVASAVSKPDGLLVVAPEREEAFLLPLPVERLWGVGAVTAEKLHGLGIRTVGQLAELEAATAERILGKAVGGHLHALARLRDPRPVDTTRRRGSIGSQRALGSRPRSVDELDLILTQIVDRLAKRLRDGGRVCRTVVLRLRYGDFSKATRSRTVRMPTDRTEVLLGMARMLLAAAQAEITERGITLIGISLSHLDRADQVQPELPIDWDDDGERIDTVLDAVRDRFGSASVARAAQLGRDPGWSSPVLPEHE